MASPRAVGGRVQTRRDCVGRVHGSWNQSGDLENCKQCLQLMKGCTGRVLVGFKSILAPARRPGGQRVKSCKGQCWFHPCCYWPCQSDNDLHVPGVYFFVLKTLVEGEAPSECTAADSHLSCTHTSFQNAVLSACSTPVLSLDGRSSYPGVRPGAFPSEPVLLWLSPSSTWTQIIREMMHKR